MRKISSLFFLLSMFLFSGTPSAKPEPQADKILVEKAARKLTLFQKGKVLKNYDISLGQEPVGAKQQEGDGKTPEGSYVIDYRNPNSAFHLSLHISYPNARDQKQARARGVSPGGQIMIHGLPNGTPSLLGNPQRLFDWTNGCIAVNNSEIEEIWKRVPNGTPIEIRP
ncbi:MAG TPA: hypothetical protein DF383_03890 [Deltaproteobacteria bacterium]|nr:hypothetical protein [Deltaproteobacteria bacterium]